MVQTVEVSAVVMLRTWAIAVFTLIHVWKTTHLVIPQIPLVMMIIEGGSTEGGVLTFVQQEDAGIRKSKQTGIYIFQKYQLDSRQVWGGNVSGPDARTGAQSSGEVL